MPAALRDTLLRAAEANLYQPRWSGEIFDELHRVLVRERLTDAAAAGRLIDAMERAFPGARVREYEHLVESMSNDRSDRHVLAASVVAGVGTIVTANLRHFPASALMPFGIRAFSPDQFLIGLVRRDQDAMIRVIRQQAADFVHRRVARRMYSIRSTRTCRSSSRSCVRRWPMGNLSSDCRDSLALHPF
ncbi:MAG: PIN domain-containing protein [Dehalococcoidia bacterium]